jgi:hypothetical protein
MSDDTKLMVRTRSIVTAGAIVALTDVMPEILRRPGGGDPTFQFPPECEPALRRFLRAKLSVDRLIEECQ